MERELSDLAKKIEYWREVRGLSQSQLSVKAGLTPSAVNDIVRAPDRSPRLATVEQLASALGITLWQLISPPGAAPQAAAANPRTGVAVIQPSGFTAGDHLLIAEYADALGFDPASASLAIALGFEGMGFGFVPGTPVIVIPAPDYTDEVVVAFDEESQSASFRYCAPPWLFGFRNFGAPFHEFYQRPGLSIIGVVRSRGHVEGALGRSFPPVPEHDSGTENPLAPSNG